MEHQSTNGSWVVYCAHFLVNNHFYFYYDCVLIARFLLINNFIILPFIYLVCIHDIFNWSYPYITYKRLRIISKRKKKKTGCTCKEKGPMLFIQQPTLKLCSNFWRCNVMLVAYWFLASTIWALSFCTYKKIINGTRLLTDWILERWISHKYYYYLNKIG